MRTVEAVPTYTCNYMDPSANRRITPQTYNGKRNRPKKAEQLKKLRIDMVEDFQGSPRTLSAKTAVTQKVAHRWIQETDEHIKEAS